MPSAKQRDLPILISDGTADVTDALSEWVRRAKEIPPGTYLISSTVRLPPLNTERYISRIPVANLTLNQINDLIESIREHGYAKLDPNTNAINAIWEVGPNSSVADLWDLREIANEFEADTYPAIEVPKPERITETVTV